VRSVPRLCEFYPGICLTAEEKARKNLSQGKKNLSQVKKNLSNKRKLKEEKTWRHEFLCPNKHRLRLVAGVRDSPVGSGTTLQVGRSPVLFPMVSLEFFIDIILSVPYNTLIIWSRTRQFPVHSHKACFHTPVCRVPWVCRLICCAAVIILVIFNGRCFERLGARGGAVGWGYKPEGRELNSRWCHWNCS
jgi:hypothetical protein